MIKLLRMLFIVLALAAVALSYWVVPKVQYDSDIMTLFPQDAQTPGISRANDLLAQGVTDKLFFLISSSDWQATQDAVPDFAQALSTCACIESVTARQDASAFQQLQQHYQQFGSMLLSEKDKVLLERGQADVLVNSSLRDLMVNPGNISSARIIEDPLSLTDDFVSHLQEKTAGRGSVENGYIYFSDKDTDRRYVLVVAELSGSPYSLSAQAATEEAVETAQARFTEAVPDADIVGTGAYFYAHAGSQQAQTEISTVGLGSLLGIVIIFLLAFRSLSLLLLALLPIAAGILVGLSVTSLVFGSVQIIALVFGASLIGVSIDYSLHFLCKRQAMGAGWQPQLGLQKLIAGLTLGMLTSVAGYLSFSAAGFPGFSQIAVFSCAGLVAAYLVVVGFYPWILQKPGKSLAPALIRTRIPRYLAVVRANTRRLTHLEILLPAMLFIIAGLWQLQVEDDVRVMQTPDAEARAQESRFRELVGSVTAIQYLLVRAESEEALLQKLEQLQEPLRQATKAGTLSSYISLADWLPSEQTQQENNTLVRQQLIKSGQLQDYLNKLGVNAETQTQSMQAYAATGTPPDETYLTLDNTLPLVERLLKRPLYFTDDDKHYSLVLLEGLSDPTPLKQLAEDHETVIWADQVATTSQLLEKYRFSASVVLAVAYALILLLLMARYGWRGSLLVVLPPLLASLVALALLGWLGIGVSVFNIMALLLVLGIGIDYTLFLRESAGRGYDTLFAIGLSSLTTLLSFGLLSLSATHAIFSFGLVVLVGIAVSFLLAPLAIQSDQSRAH